MLGSSEAQTVAWADFCRFQHAARSKSSHKVLWFFRDISLNLVLAIVFLAVSGLGVKTFDMLTDMDSSSNHGNIRQQKEASTAFHSDFT